MKTKKKEKEKKEKRKTRKEVRRMEGEFVSILLLNSCDFT